ncbi:hypothetical protein V8C44DRAFT_318361 [Trichoderma aethiopicum]
MKELHTEVSRVPSRLTLLFFFFIHLVHMCFSDAETCKRERRVHICSCSRLLQMLPILGTSSFGSTTHFHVPCFGKRPVGMDAGHTCAHA